MSSTQLVLKKAPVALRTDLREAEDGATVMEFGLVAVVFITMMLGMFDIGQSAYAQAILNGAVEEAARTSSLETGDTSEADARVLKLVKSAAPGASISSTRTSYFDFNDIERPEKWNDGNFDNDCNPGESYTDENRNGQWDRDVGIAGNGGAGDVVIYTVRLTYSPLFPIPFWDNSDATRTMEAVAIKKNQPFADQTDYGSTAGVC